MKYLLGYDTETTGLPLFSEPSDDPRQPHLVQVGAVLADIQTRKVVASIDLIIRPHGWEIPPDVAEIHGINTDLALAVGVPEEVALTALLDLWRAADVRVGHNESFDARMVRIAIKRLLQLDELADEWKAAPALCTATRSTKIVNAPPTEKMRASGRNHAKKPKLSEAYKHFTGRDLVGAHTAMADTLACLDVHWALEDLEAGGTPAAPPAPQTTQDDNVPFL